MSLALITPTRRRWHWLRKQARAIAGQLSPDDCWIVAVDNDQANPRVADEIGQMIPAQQLVWLHCAYARPTPPVACVNRLRNAATALAPAAHDIVEVDDHDLLAPYALAEIRAALSAGYDYVFGWYHQQAVVERCGIEKWPEVEHRYQRGAFERREIDGIGVRAFKRWLWQTLGGWSTNVWPGGDYHFALRAERLGANIVCLEQPLCTVTIEAESLSAEFVRSA
ncbi:MAG TPA: hypothetical protein VNH11_08860 [Pirellulales bacterium]|nr:hypothetical protein [Pirellulales bacterium]